MKKKGGLIFPLRPPALLVTMLAVLSIASMVDASNGGPVIIGNKGIGVDSLSPAEIKHIFLGEKKLWNDNRQVMVATLEEEKIHQRFLKKYVGKSPLQYRNYWRNMIFTGKGRQAPKVFASEKELIRFVAETEGAIGYISSAINIQNVKVIAVSTGGNND